MSGDGRIPSGAVDALTGAPPPSQTGGAASTAAGGSVLFGAEIGTTIAPYRHSSAAPLSDHADDELRAEQDALQREMGDLHRRFAEHSQTIATQAQTIQSLGTAKAEQNDLVVEQEARIRQLQDQLERKQLEIESFRRDVEGRVRADAANAQHWSELHGQLQTQREVKPAAPASTSHTCLRVFKSAQCYLGEPEARAAARQHCRRGRTPEAREGLVDAAGDAGEQVRHRPALGAEQPTSTPECRGVHTRA